MKDIIRELERVYSSIIAMRDDYSDIDNPESVYICDKLNIALESIENAEETLCKLSSPIRAMAYVSKDEENQLYIGDYPITAGDTIEVLPVDSDCWLESPVGYKENYGFFLIRYPRIDIYGLVARIRE